MNRRRSKARYKVPTPPAVPVPIPVSGRLFWHVMLYGCDGGEYAALRYLEVGCEGPRVADRWTTPGGRRIVPVPFYAGRCPLNHPMSHIEWVLDQTLDPPIPFAEVPDYGRAGRGRGHAVGLFLYPSPEEFTQDPESACGRPIWKRDL